MNSKNVESHRASHESWNKRDFAGVVRNCADNVEYTDQAQNRTMKGKDKFQEWVESWAKAFPDGRITKSEYFDAGDVVIARFVVEGTNSGPYGSLKPTGRKISVPFCDIAHFDQQGKCRMGSCYYDQYTMLSQLGHLQQTKAAA
jgi:steroid delta-isomerase-like uncharacterized protein